jgi:hypothetical protein
MSAGNFVGGIIVGVPALVCIYVALVLPFDPEYQKMSRERAEIARQAELLQKRLDGDVVSCLRGDSPWKCFLKLGDMDRTDPVPPDAGASRIRRLAKSVSAEEVLAFCSQPRKIDCAEQMIGDGYSRSDIQSALEN